MQIERLFVEEDPIKKTGATIDRYRLTVLLSEPNAWYEGHVARLFEEPNPWITVTDNYPAFFMDMLATLEASMNTGETRPGYLQEMLQDYADSLNLSSVDLWQADDSYTLQDYLEDLEYENYQEDL